MQADWHIVAQGNVCLVGFEAVGIPGGEGDSVAISREPVRNGTSDVRTAAQNECGLLFGSISHHRASLSDWAEEKVSAAWVDFRISLNWLTRVSESASVSAFRRASLAR